MGARGNSGVILSQILRGVADAFRAGDGDGATVADALTRAAEGAYRAVLRPVEGTILSVVKAAATAATDAAGGALVEVLRAAHDAAAAALARTPDQLPTLRAAGVVDAGGAGFVLLLDAFLNRSADHPLPRPTAEPAGAGVSPATTVAAAPPTSDLQPPAHDPVGELRYEVMFFLDAPDDAVDDFRACWAEIGDSIVVVGGDGLWNCHIHTDDVGAAIEAGVDAGRPRQIRVTDLHQQVEEERRSHPATGPATPVACSAVAVATGDGIRRIFQSLGVHHTIRGGQSMNPSTAQLLAAIDTAPGREVVLLPNNKNILPVAEQAVKVAAKPARVVATRSITEGFAALMAYDPQASADDNAAHMGEAAARVISGEITVAVRDSTSDVGPIRQGDYLGLSRDGIEVVAPTLAGAVADLLAKLLTESHEIVTIIEGDGASRADTRQVTDWLSEKRPDVTAEVHHGGQPLYPYLLSIE
jgi:DAK2 domain fusion protein YloV